MGKRGYSWYATGLPVLAELAPGYGTPSDYVTGISHNNQAFIGNTCPQGQVIIVSINYGMK